MTGSGVGWILLKGLAGLVILLAVEPLLCTSLLARCPMDDTAATDTYCQCQQNRIRSGIFVNITCDFMKKEDVLLTEEIYPFRRTRAVSMYVRVSNAISVRVTEGFMGAWLGVPSAGLDLWHSGTVSLAPAPIIPSRFHSFRTYAGLGLVGCHVPELPGRLLRNRHLASLRIKNSVMGTIHQGLLHNIRQLQYLVVQDSTVEVVKGSLSTGGTVTLSNVPHATWNGLILSNVTIKTVAADSFNLVYQHIGQSDSVHKVEVQECQVGQLGTGALTVVGDIAVTIKGNVFTDLASQAFRINVTSDLKFEENVAVRAHYRSLEGIVCHNFASLEKNTVHLNTMPDYNVTTSIIPFHTTCGLPQVFTVVSPAQPLVIKVASVATWVLLAVLLLLLLAGMVVAVLRWRHNNMRREFTHNNSFHFHNGLKSSTHDQQGREDINMLDEAVRVGVSNPLYEDMEYKSSL